MTNRLAVALLATVLATAAGADDKAAAARKSAGTMEVQKAGKGQAAGTRTVKLRAKVTAVDAANRTITLQGAKGKSETFKVSPAVQRLDEIQPGDDVVVNYQQGLILQAQAAGDKDAQPTGYAAAARNEPEQAPGGEAMAHVRTTVNVVAVDPKSRVVVLEGPQGGLHKVKAAKDVDLKKVKPGTKLVAEYTESLAVSIEKAKPAEPAAPAKP